ncbi:MAG: hypothetical protein B6D55_06855 [Candidatus Omnitrophica bacterium 4484_70.2]|nr:MAG: hypothetical protein B6D55_06855 [Candidatus Omnitrophica bacterium 4484_70.2]
MKSREVKINQVLCRGCGACQRVCPSGAINLVFGKAYVDKEKCMGCYKCISVCPFGAISQEEDFSFSQEIERLEKDIADLKKRIDNILKK